MESDKHHAIIIGEDRILAGDEKITKTSPAEGLWLSLVRSQRAGRVITIAEKREPDLQ
jgi:hypothetical protein